MQVGADLAIDAFAPPPAARPVDASPANEPCFDDHLEAEAAAEPATPTAESDADHPETEDPNPETAEAGASKKLHSPSEQVTQPVLVQLIASASAETAPQATPVEVNAQATADAQSSAAAKAQAAAAEKSASQSAQATNNAASASGAAQTQLDAAGAPTQPAAGDTMAPPPQHAHEAGAKTLAPDAKLATEASAQTKSAAAQPQPNSAPQMQDANTASQSAPAQSAASAAAPSANVQAQNAAQMQTTQAAAPLGAAALEAKAATATNEKTQISGDTPKSDTKAVETSGKRSAGPSGPAPQTRGDVFAALLTQTVAADAPQPQAPPAANAAFGETTPTTASAAQIDATAGRAIPAATQVGREIIRRFNGENTRFDLRLDPPELGRVEVRLEVSRDHRVTAIVAADNPQALAELSRHARDLEQALQSAGLELSEDGLSFDLSDQRQGFADAEPNSGGRTSGAATAEDAQPERRAAPIHLERWRGQRVDVMA